ncbi:hypothetical protein ABIA35_002279 [Catenulispora sp. MAP12-49]|uniref:hypothetical protein n=1 Tax=Catenulispora sp. MAP12-49 TaxID=3156302 RepID=UPI0035155DB9
MSRGPIGRRYWSSLTGLGSGPAPERDWRGQTFWRRYVASFFVLPQPSAGSETGAEVADADTDTEAGTVSVPQHIRSPKLVRYQAAVLVGAVALVVVVVSVTQGGGQPSNGSNPSGPTSSSTASVPPTTATGPTKAPTTIPSKPGPWQGTVRVTMNGEHVTAGPIPGAGLVFGLQVGAQGTLVGPGNLAAWTADKSPTAAGCVALLQGHAVYQAAVKVGDQLCVAALNGRTALAKVSAEDQDASNGQYIDLDVLAYAAAS